MNTSGVPFEKPCGDVNCEQAYLTPLGHQLIPLVKASMASRANRLARPPTLWLCLKETVSYLSLSFLGGASSLETYEGLL